MKKYTGFILLLLILCLAAFLRFYQLTSIPPGLNQDESAIGYNAYTVLKTGKDEHGVSLPLYFKSFGDKKLPVYIYMTAASEKVFGLNEFAVRLPSAILGVFAVLLLFLVVKEFTNNRQLALLSAFLLAITPWHLLFSRAAFEVNGALTFTLLGVWFFLVGLRTKPWLFLPLSMIGFALSLYSYNVTRLLAPLLLVTLIWCSWERFKKISLFVKGFSVSVLLVLLLPFLATFFTSSGAASAQGALITSNDIEAQRIEMRHYVAEETGLLGKLFYNKPVYMLWQYIENFGLLFSASFFFVSGSEHGTQSIGDTGNFYLFQLPLIILGCIFFSKKQIKGLRFFVCWAIFAAMTVALSKDVPHATRGYFLVIPGTVFSAAGILALAHWIRQRKNLLVRLTLISICSLFFIYNLVYYFSSYYLRFPIVYEKQWKQQDESLTKYLVANENKYNQIILDDKDQLIYTSFLFYSAYPPEKFLKEVQWYPDDIEGGSTVKSIGKYHWRPIDWKKDIISPKTLIVTNGNLLPSNAKVIKEFIYPLRPVVLSVKEQLLYPPIKDVAYTLIEGRKKQ